MSATPIPAPVQASAPDLARRVALIVAGLAALVARRFLREPRLAALIIPLWTRLTRTAGRFERLMARLAANRPPKPRPPRPRRPTPHTARPNPFPTAHGWLIRALPHEAAAYAAQLDSLLAEPGIADLFAACPQARRILRPLGRMLGLRALAPKRHAATRHPASPGAAPPRAALKPPPPFASHPPNARWPHRPSAHWPTACRRRAQPA